MSEWIEIYINGEHSHDREIKFLPLNKHDIEKISNFHRHQCSDYGSFLIEIYLKNGHLIFSTEMPSQALSLKAAWIKCADQMPDCDELREKPQEALFWIYCQIDGRHFVTRAYRQFRSKKWAWVDKLTTKGQMILFDNAVTHYMPIIKPTPPQD